MFTYRLCWGAYWKKVDPVSCGNDTNWTGPKTLAGIAADLKNVYNIDAEALRWDNRTAGGTTPAQKASLSKTKITEALKNNSPVIALIKPIQAALGTSGNGAHYITLVGLNGNKVIIANSAGGLREEYDLDWVIEKIYENANTTECGIVVTKEVVLQIVLLHHQEVVAHHLQVIIQLLILTKVEKVKLYQHLM